MVFLEACTKGDKRKVVECLATWHHEERNVWHHEEKNVSSFLNSGLLATCRGGYTDVAEVLILHGATDLDGGLEEACRFDQVKMIEFLLEEGSSDINTAILIAAQYNHVSAAKLLGEHGGDLYQAFLCACTYGSLAVVEWLSEDVDDLSGGLNSACEHGRVSVVQHLLERKAVVDGGTFLWACEGSIEVVEEILPHLPTRLLTVNLLNAGLFQAASRGKLKIVQKLALLGADAWGVAFFHACEGTLDVDTLMELISHGATDMKKVPVYLIPVLLNRGVDPVLFGRRATLLVQARETRQAVTRKALLDFSGLSEDCLDSVLLKYLNYSVTEV